MLIVQNGSQLEPLNHTQNLEVNQEVNGALTAQFASFNVPNNPAYSILQEEAIVTIDGFDFRVKQIEKNRLGKSVSAHSTFFDLADKRQDSIYGGTRTFNEFATFTLNGSGWTFTSEVTGSRLIANYGEANIITLIQALCSAYECEYEIKENNVVHFANQIGGDYDAQYRYGHNVESLKEKVDTSKLKTQITGTGANGLTVTYTSPFADNPNIGIRVAEPISDDRYTQAESLLEHLKRELIDYPEATFEMNTVELTNKELGERVWLIYDPLGIEFQTRILKQTKEIRNGKLVTTKVVLGNTLPKSNTDILVTQKVEIDENKKEYRSRFEQTNELITLEVEAVNSSIASINIRADNIIAQVEAVDDSVAALDIKANNITLSVTSLNTRVGQTESSISIQAGEISSKVSATDFNGQNIVSKVNQTASSFSIDASKINLNGYVTISSLGSSGSVTIDSGNIYGSSFVVGKGTGSTLTMTAYNGSHLLQSNDAAGFRIGSNGSMGLSASGYYGVYVPNSALVAQAGFRVEGGVSQFNTSVTVNSSITANSMYIGSSPVPDNNVMNASISSAIDQLERDIVAWANGKFALK